MAVGLVVMAVGNLVAAGGGLLHAEAGWFAAITLSYCMTLPFLWLPFRTTFVTCCLISAAGVASSFHYAEGPPDRVFAGPLVALLPLTVFLLPMVAWVGERTLRGRFVDERTIAHQQALLNTQHQKLVEIEALIRRYAPAAVADRIERGDESVNRPQRRRVTAFSSDVVGFTLLADQLDPEALAEIINEYVGDLAGIVHRHHGTVTEFAGDGLMAIFGAPEDMEPVEPGPRRPGDGPRAA